MISILVNIFSFTILSTAIADKLPCNQVMEVQAEYFPPTEDIILQNEGAADIYVIVSGAVVSFYL